MCKSLNRDLEYILRSVWSKMEVLMWLSVAALFVIDIVKLLTFVWIFIKLRSFIFDIRADF